MHILTWHSLLWFAFWSRHWLNKIDDIQQDVICFLIELHSGSSIICINSEIFCFCVSIDVDSFICSLLIYMHNSLFAIALCLFYNCCMVNDILWHLDFRVKDYSNECGQCVQIAHCTICIGFCPRRFYLYLLHLCSMLSLFCVCPGGWRNLTCIWQFMWNL